MTKMEDNYVFNREELLALAEAQRIKHSGRHNPAEDIVLREFRCYIPDLKKCSGMKHAMDLYSIVYRTRIEVKAKANNVNGIDVKFLYDAERHPEDKVFIFINMIPTLKPMTLFMYGEFFIIDGYNLTKSQLSMIMETIKTINENPTRFYNPIQRYMKSKYGNRETDLETKVNAIMKHLNVQKQEISTDESSIRTISSETSISDDKQLTNKENDENESLTSSSHNSINEIENNSIVHLNKIEIKKQYDFDYDWNSELRLYEESAKNEIFTNRVEVIDYLLECCRETIENWYIPYEQFCNSIKHICIASKPKIDIGTTVDIGRDVKVVVASSKFNWYCKKWGNKEVGRWVISKSPSLTLAKKLPRNGMRDGGLVRMTNEIRDINVSDIPAKEIEFIPCSISETRFDGLKLLSGLTELISIHKAFNNRFHTKPSGYGYHADDNGVNRIVNLGQQLSNLRSKRNYGLELYNFIMTNVYNIVETKDMSVSMNVILQSIDEAVRDNVPFTDKRFSIYSGSRTDNTSLFIILYEVRYMRRDGSDLIRFLTLNKPRLEAKLREHKQAILDNNLHVQTRSNGQIALCYEIDEL